MIKIAIEIKEDRKEIIREELKKRNYDIDIVSFNTTWVYDLKNVRYENNYIFLENGSFYTYKLDLKDVDYFEIHKQEEV